MSYNIETTPHFEKELKDLAKRYKSMKQDFGKFKESLKEDPFKDSLNLPKSYFDSGRTVLLCLS